MQLHAACQNVCHAQCWTLLISSCPLLPWQYAFNLFSHNSPMTGNGYNEEEMKMVKETRKIWGDDNVAITATCIRVPIMRAHAESINLELDREMSEAEVGVCGGESPSHACTQPACLQASSRCP